LFILDLQSRTPIYEQLYKKIVELIINKTLKAHDQLPSVRVLAKDLGVNPNTVSKAYQQLEHDGFIYSLAGRGSFIANINSNAAREKALSDFDRCVKEAMNAGFSKEELSARILDMETGDLND
jgi:GntR family transcriptional regulator